MFIVCFTANLPSSEEEDDETVEWEQEQLRRGGHRTPEPSSSKSKVKQVYKAAPSESNFVSMTCLFLKSLGYHSSASNRSAFTGTSDISSV